MISETLWVVGLFFLTVGPTFRYYLRESTVFLHTSLISRITCLFSCQSLSAGTANAFKSQLEKFWSHHPVRFDFIANLTSIENELEVKK